MLKHKSTFLILAAIFIDLELLKLFFKIDDPDPPSKLKFLQLAVCHPRSSGHVGCTLVPWKQELGVNWVKQIRKKLFHFFLLFSVPVLLAPLRTDR